MRKQIPTVIQWVRNFGGVHQKTVQENIPPGEWWDALNYELSDVGELAPREGYKRKYSSCNTPDGEEVRTIYQANFDGTYKLLIATDEHVYWLNSSGVWTLLYTFLDPTGNPTTFVLLNEATVPTVVFGNGKDHPQKYDGASVTATGTDTPHGRPIMFKSYLCMFNIDGDPGKVIIATNPNDPDTWVDSGGSQKYLETVGAVTSALEYNGGLVVFTNNRCEFYIGDPDELTAMQVLSTNIGCARHETVADCQGLLVWLSYAGPMVWDGGGIFPSDNLGNPADFRKSNIAKDMDKLYWTGIANFCGVYEPSKKRYYLIGQKQPVAGGTVYDRIWVFSFGYGAWFPWDISATAVGLILNETTNKQELNFGTSAGVILDPYPGQFLDQGINDAANTTYQYWIESGEQDQGAPNDQKIYRAFWFATKATSGDAPGGTRTLTVQYSGDYKLSPHGSVSATKSTGSFILGVGILGTSTLGEAGFYEDFKRFALRAKHIRFKIIGSGKTNALAIAAYALEFRPGVRREDLVP